MGLEDQRRRVGRSHVLIEREYVGAVVFGLLPAGMYSCGPAVGFVGGIDGFVGDEEVGGHRSQAARMHCCERAIKKPPPRASGVRAGGQKALTM